MAAPTLLLVPGPIPSVVPRALIRLAAVVVPEAVAVRPAGAVLPPHPVVVLRGLIRPVVAARVERRGLQPP